MKLNALVVDPAILGPLGLGLHRARLRHAPGPRRDRVHSGRDARPAGPGAPPRRRRLGQQAVPSGGGHGSHRGRGPAPPPRAGPRGLRAADRRRPRDPRGPLPGLRCRREPRPDPPRVRAAPGSCRSRRQGARARRDLSPGLGLRDDPRRPLRRRLRPEAALQAPAALARLGLHTHALRHRLPVRSAAARGRGRARRREDRHSRPRRPSRHPKRRPRPPPGTDDIRRIRDLGDTRRAAGGIAHFAALRRVSPLVNRSATAR